MVFLSLLHFLASCLLALYGANALLLSLLYLRGRGQTLLDPPAPAQWPPVTVQAPIFNELHVVEGLIEALAGLDYPRDRLQIQILDDSTDETTAIAAARIERYQREGLDIHLLHRSDRQGFKAGALAEALPAASGELIAIFDADFIPPADFLRRAAPWMAAQPRAGFLQARWSHLNARYSPLTQAQALALDGHFVVEQSTRQRNGWFFGFNGTAGLWRTACIVDAGGWTADTLCEDLDLSYRAQLRGWRGLYLPDLAAPAEIPPQLAAFKRQQSRWATGSIQTARKLGGEVLRSPRPVLHKVEGLIHLAAYLCHPLMLLLLLLTPPLVWWGDAVANPLRWLLPFLSLASIGPPLLYILSQWDLYRREGWGRRLTALPLLVLLGTGVTLSNTVAVARGLSRRPAAFQRTPKFRVQARHDTWQDKPYTLPLSGMVLGELALAGYALLAVAAAWLRGQFYAVPFMLLYVGGFGCIALLGMLQSWQRRAWRQRPGVRRSRRITARA